MSSTGKCGPESLRSNVMLDGARVANQIKHEVKQDVDRLRRDYGIIPTLAAVLVGNDPASEVYVRSKVRTSETLGLGSELFALPDEITSSELLHLVQQLNEKDDIDGILVQLPLPRQIDTDQILEAVDPAKDVDGFHPLNVGRLAQGRQALAPCTPAGIIELLLRESIEIRGAHTCVIGRSQIVGRPLAQLLLQRDATVTVCHSQTRDIASITTTADILVAATGCPNLVRRHHVKPGATVIDVGMNRIADEGLARELFGERAPERIESIRRRGYTLVGDVNQAEVEEVAGRLTPVPGGVGPLTVAMLMRNTVTAATRRRALKKPGE